MGKVSIAIWERRVSPVLPAGLVLLGAMVAGCTSPPSRTTQPRPRAVGDRASQAEIENLRISIVELSDCVAQLAAAMEAMNSDVGLDQPELLPDEPRAPDAAEVERAEDSPFDEQMPIGGGAAAPAQGSAAIPIEPEIRRREREQPIVNHLTQVAQRVRKEMFGEEVHVVRGKTAPTDTPRSDHHLEGRAIDIRSRDLTPAERHLEARELSRELGPDYVVVVEEIDPETRVVTHQAYAQGWRGNKKEFEPGESKTTGTHTHIHKVATANLSATPVRSVATRAKQIAAATRAKAPPPPPPARDPQVEELLREARTDRAMSRADQ